MLKQTTTNRPNLLVLIIENIENLRNYEFVTEM